MKRFIFLIILSLVTILVACSVEIEEIIINDDEANIETNDETEESQDNEEVTDEVEQESFTCDFEGIYWGLRDATQTINRIYYFENGKCTQSLSTSSDCFISTYDYVITDVFDNGDYKEYTIDFYKEGELWNTGHFKLTDGILAILLHDGYGYSEYFNCEIVEHIEDFK